MCYDVVHSINKPLSLHVSSQARRNFRHRSPVSLWPPHSSMATASQTGRMTLPTVVACGACSGTLPKQFYTIITRSDSWLSAAGTECGGETRSAERQRPAAPPGAQRDAGRRSQALPGAARGADEASAARASSRTLRPSLSAASPDRKALSVSVSSGSRFYANIVAKLHRERAAREEARTNDKWLVDVRSQQECPRRAREHRAQKVQSEN